MISFWSGTVWNYLWSRLCASVNAAQHKAAGICSTCGPLWQCSSKYELQPSTGSQDAFHWLKVKINNPVSSHFSTPWSFSCLHLIFFCLSPPRNMSNGQLSAIAFTPLRPSCSVQSVIKTKQVHCQFQSESFKDTFIGYFHCVIADPEICSWNAMERELEYSHMYKTECKKVIVVERTRQTEHAGSYSWQY